MVRYVDELANDCLTKSRKSRNFNISQETGKSGTIMLIKRMRGRNAVEYSDREARILLRKRMRGHNPIE